MKSDTNRRPNSPFLGFGMNASDFEWTVDNEIQLFYAMMGHKPVGINKHFQMLVLHNQFSQQIGAALSSKCVWKKLESLYHLEALDDTEDLLFPNYEQEFSLPEKEFGHLLEEKMSHDKKEEGRSRGRSSKREKESAEKDGGISSRRDRRDEDELETPTRLVAKRTGRDSKPASPASTPVSKRRR